MGTKPRQLRAQIASRAAVPAPMSEPEFEAFYRQVFLPLVRRVVWKHRLSNEDARDLVQDAFVLAVPRLDGRGNPRAWLIQIVDYLAMNYRRKQIRRVTLAQRWGLSSKARDDSETEESDDYL
jgi:DNA-directed RNA polymerase specialized sigma24 family protein